jgi:N-(2-amino-2-carboxyethyl)-L-glutamate synthase
VIYKSAQELVLDDVFVELQGFIPQARVYLKLEHFNATGSIKLKTALHIVGHLERLGRLAPEVSELVESSSGNLGVALAMVCRQKGYRFTCVVDPNISESNAALIELFGGNVVRVSERDENGGYLGTRIRQVRAILESRPQAVWANQYESPGNVEAHFSRTAASVFGTLKDLDFLFVGAGTCGTLMGCARYIRHHQLRTRLVAADPVGSVSFGYPPSARHVPGLGMSQRPPLLEEALVDHLIRVPEAEGVQWCRRLVAEHGLFLGGSSGIVLAAMQRFAPRIPSGASCAAIMPDGGLPYLETIYNDAWLAEKRLADDEMPALRGAAAVRMRRRALAGSEHA